MLKSHAVTTPGSLERTFDLVLVVRLVWGGEGLMHYYLWPPYGHIDAEVTYLYLHNFKIYGHSSSYTLIVLGIIQLGQNCSKYGAYMRW